MTALVLLLLRSVKKMNRQLSSRINAVATLAPATRNTAATGATVDLKGFNAAAIEAVSGVITDGVHALTVQESDDGAAWADVAVADLQGAFVNLAANAVQEVGYSGSKRFIRVNVAASGTTGGAYTVVVVLGRPRVMPS